MAKRGVVSLAAALYYYNCLKGVKWDFSVRTIVQFYDRVEYFLIVCALVVCTPEKCFVLVPNNKVQQLA